MRKPKPTSAPTRPIKTLRPSTRSNTSRSLISPHTTSQLVWVNNNRGVMSEVAVECGVTPQYVHMILRGKRHNTLVETKLRAAGAPVGSR